MEATLKKQRHQGALIITGPLVSPALTYLSALSGCRVTRTKDAKFARREQFKKRMLLSNQLAFVSIKRGEANEGCWKDDGMYEYWQRVQKFELELPRRLINLENLAYRGEIRNWLDEYIDRDYYTDYIAPYR